MDSNKSITHDLLQLKEALIKVKSSAEKYSVESKKSLSSLTELSQSLSELSALKLTKNS